MGWGQDSEWNDGYFTTSSDSPRPHITLKPYFTLLVFKLDVVQMKEKTSPPGLKVIPIEKCVCAHRAPGTLKVHLCQRLVNNQAAKEGKGVAGEGMG